jgi:hypothetical protein
MFIGTAWEATAQWSCRRTRAADGHRKAQTVHPRCSCVRVCWVCALRVVLLTGPFAPFQLRQKGEKERRDGTTVVSTQRKKAQERSTPGSGGVT